MAAFTRAMQVAPGKEMDAALNILLIASCAHEFDFFFFPTKLSAEISAFLKMKQHCTLEWSEISPLLNFKLPHFQTLDFSFTHELNCCPPYYSAI